jgi:hypothetical protein
MVARSGNKACAPPSRAGFFKALSGEIFWVGSDTLDGPLKMMGISREGIYGRAYPDPKDEPLLAATAAEIEHFKRELALYGIVAKRQLDDQLRGIYKSIASSVSETNDS